MQTTNLNLVAMTRDEVLAMVEALGPDERKEVSPEWLARVRTSLGADPWVLGFSLEHRQTGATVGKCAFKSPPSADGTVEIAYGIDPDHRGKGYATEAAAALTAFAFESGLVQTVVAHTLPEPNASTRVLAKCGFAFVGEVVDPEDGPVWRWEKRREAAKGSA
jgi:ribosomal-protein-alanine N-acetyltransferase